MPGKNTIHLKMIKRLPTERMTYILDTWKEGVIPKDWKSVTITPLLKEEKYPKDSKYKQASSPNQHTL